MLGKKITIVMTVALAGAVLSEQHSQAQCTNATAAPPTLSIRVLQPNSNTFLTGSGNSWFITDVAGLNQAMQFSVDLYGLDGNGASPQLVRAAQFFLEYTSADCAGATAAFSAFTIEPGEPGSPAGGDVSPFQQMITQNQTNPVIGGSPGLVEYGVGIPLFPTFEPQSACDDALATFTFTPTQEGHFVVYFRDPNVAPQTKLADDAGSATVPPALVLAQPDAANALTITVDFTVPTFAELAGALDQTIECSDSTDPAVNAALNQPTPSDNCGLAATNALTFTDDTSGLTGCDATGMRVRTWTATDAAGNTNTYVQNITVVDTIGPTLTPPANITIECNTDSSPTATGTATATDFCDPSPVISRLADVPSAGACPNEQTIMRPWIAFDACGNASTVGTQTITVVDTTPPTVTAPTATSVQCQADVPAAAVDAAGLAAQSGSASDN
ncbi:MAG: hypothetical protein ACE5F9_14700, partial [Phycisphaerae bacterium]